MSRNILYRVYVYVDDDSGTLSRDTRCVYETTKRDKAEKFLSKYLKTYPDVTRAYIERFFVINITKRNYQETDE